MSNPFYLYDSKGRAYQFASEGEVEGKRLASGKAPGYAVGEGKAPANWEQISQGAEVGGRHKGEQFGGQAFHLQWERGPLEINRPDLGYVGLYSCVHRHMGIDQAVAMIDFDYIVMPL
jgi:hypothetical protein